MVTTSALQPVCAIVVVILATLSLSARVMQLQGKEAGGAQEFWEKIFEQVWKDCIGLEYNDGYSEMCEVSKWEHSLGEADCKDEAFAWFQGVMTMEEKPLEPTQDTENKKAFMTWAREDLVPAVREFPKMMTEFRSHDQEAKAALKLETKPRRDVKRNGFTVGMAKKGYEKNLARLVAIVDVAADATRVLREKADTAKAAAVDAKAVAKGKFSKIFGHFRFEVQDFAPVRHRNDGHYRKEYSGKYA